jgi:hypothetical protein
MIEELKIYRDVSELIKRVFIIKPFSIYIRNSTKYRAKRALKKEAINSYYGLMGQANCYNLRVSIAKRNNFTMFYYQKLI